MNCPDRGDTAHQTALLNDSGSRFLICKNGIQKQNDLGWGVRGKPFCLNPNSGYWFSLYAAVRPPKKHHQLSGQWVARGRWFLGVWRIAAGWWCLLNVCMPTRPAHLTPPPLASWPGRCQDESGTISSRRTRLEVGGSAGGVTCLWVDFKLGCLFCMNFPWSLLRRA